MNPPCNSELAPSQYNEVEGLQFIDFLESLARIADLKNLPTNEEIRAAGFQPKTDIIKYLELVRTGEAGWLVA